MSDGLSVVQELALWKLITETLNKRRDKAMVPRSREEMASGERFAAKFGGKVAAWVSMPKPTQKSAYVKDAAKLLAWARREHPGHLADTVEIIQTPELIAHLAEHFPQALKPGFEVDPHWVSDLCKALASPEGRYETADGEVLTEVPGIEVPEPAGPVPSVTLTRDALAIVREAWPSIRVGDLLAIPAPEASDAA